MRPAWMGGRGGTSEGSGPTDTDMASSRAAAWAGSGTQMILPSSMANSMLAHTSGWRSLS